MLHLHNIYVLGCQPEHFECDSHRCVDISKRCDSQSDCDDGADELDCSGSIVPSSFGACLFES